MCVYCKKQRKNKESSHLWLGAWATYIYFSGTKVLSVPAIRELVLEKPPFYLGGAYTHSGRTCFQLQVSK